MQRSDQTNTSNQSQASDNQSPRIRPRRDTFNPPVFAARARKRSLSLFRSNFEDQIFDTYIQANSLLLNFDDKIKQCKAFNQQQIHKKYESIINGLILQLKDVRNQLQSEQSKGQEGQAFIDMKHEVQELRSKNVSLLQLLQNLNKQKKVTEKRLLSAQILNKNLMNRLKRQQRQEGKTRTLAQTTIQQQRNSNRVLSFLQKEVKDFLKLKSRQSEENRTSRTPFQSFLWANLQRLWKTQFSQFLQMCDEFVLRLQSTKVKQQIGWKEKFSQELIILKHTRKDNSAKVLQKSRRRLPARMNVSLDHK